MFAHSKLPLQKWLMTMVLLTSSRKGMSSVALAKHLGVQQKTAWFLAHRIREAFDLERGTMLDGVVEADETWVGGKEANKHGKKRVGTAWKALQIKHLVGGLRQRGGRVLLYPIKSLAGLSFWDPIQRRVKRGATMYTDEHHNYRALSRLGYDHHHVNHRRGLYGWADVTTNGIESVWAVLKRQYIGVHHWFSKKHTPRYLAEMEARFNGLHGSLSCLRKIVRGAEGKRLTYRGLTR